MYIQRLLICDSSMTLGRIFLDRALNMGMLPECCRNAPAVIRRRYKPEKYDGILIFAYREEPELLSFIREASEKGTRIFAAIFSSSDTIRSSYIHAGSELCFSLPFSAESIWNAIALRLSSDEGLAPQIELFLEETGFPRRLSGFCYLAKASELFIQSPDRMWGGLIDIYEETAEAFSTDASLVERAIRNLGTQISASGTLSRLTEGRLTEKPSNTELICAVCDIFARFHPEASVNMN